MSVRRASETKLDRFTHVLTVGARLFRGLSIGVPKRPNEGSSSNDPDAKRARRDDVFREAYQLLATSGVTYAQLQELFYKISTLEFESDDERVQKEANELIKRIQIAMSNLPNRGIIYDEPSQAIVDEDDETPDTRAEESARKAAEEAGAEAARKAAEEARAEAARKAAGGGGDGGSDGGDGGSDGGDGGGGAGAGDGGDDGSGDDGDGGNSVFHPTNLKMFFADQVS